MGDNHDSNKGTNFQTAGVILFLLAATFAAYVFHRICLFIQWLGEMSHQFYLYIGGAMGVARLVAFAMGAILVALTLLAWVGNEQWACHLCATLTSGTTVMFIASWAWFVNSIEQLPQYFFLGMALYVAAAVFLNIWKHQHIDLNKETNTK